MCMSNILLCFLFEKLYRVCILDVADGGGGGGGVTVSVAWNIITNSTCTHPEHVLF